MQEFNIEEKCCSKCQKIEKIDKFIKNRNICKECENKTRREKYKLIDINEDNNQVCKLCLSLIHI